MKIITFLGQLKPFRFYVITLILVLTFVLFVSEILENETYKFDLGINVFISGLRTLFWTDVMKLVSDFGMIGGVFIVGSVGTNLYFHQRFGTLIHLVSSFLSASLFTYCLKLLIARNRPVIENRLVVESGFSFPSGHTSIAFSAFLILAILVHYNPKIQYFPKAILLFSCILFPFLVAFSRLYLGVHYFTDVVAGAIVGSGTACIFLYSNSKLDNKY